MLSISIGSISVSDCSHSGGAELLAAFFLRPVQYLSHHKNNVQDPLDLDNGYLFLEDKDNHKVFERFETYLIFTVSFPPHFRIASVINALDLSLFAY